MHLVAFFNKSYAFEKRCAFLKYGEVAICG